MSEPLAKSGRGGAGNYWSKKDLDEAEKAGTRDEVRSLLYPSPTVNPLPICIINMT